MNIPHQVPRSVFLRRTPVAPFIAEFDEIDQAAGMVCVQLGVTVPVAYERLRAYAKAGTGGSLLDVAMDVIERTLDLRTSAGSE